MWKRELFSFKLFKIKIGIWVRISNRQYLLNLLIQNTLSSHNSRSALLILSHSNEFKRILTNEIIILEKLNSVHHFTCTWSKWFSFPFTSIVCHEGELLIIKNPNTSLFGSPSSPHGGLREWICVGREWHRVRAGWTESTEGVLVFCVAPVDSGQG